MRHIIVDDFRLAGAIKQRNARRWLAVSIWSGIAACLSLLICTAVAAAEQKPGNTVTWCQFDLPPMYIIDGPDAGKGSVDGHVDFLIKHMPEYQHQVQVSNIRRVTEQIRNRERVVCAGMQKNAERETYMLFSLPFLTAPPPSLVTPRREIQRMRPFLNAAGEVRLAALIEDSPMVLGVAIGRSYGRDIDEILFRSKDRPNVLVRPAGQDLTDGLIKMMSLKRIDYTIAYGNEFRALSGFDQELVALPIEGQPRFIPIYIVAQQDEWGRTFIERINQLLRTYWNDPDFRATLSFGQPPALKEASRLMLREINPNNPASAGSRAKP